MAKVRKIVVCVVCALCALTLVFPTFGADVPVDNTQTYFMIWSAAGADISPKWFNEGSTIIHWDTSAAWMDAYVTVGFDFPMLPYLSYACDFSINSNNDNKFDWLSKQPVGVYALEGEFLGDMKDNGLFGGGMTGTKLGEVMFNKDRVIATSVEYVGSQGQLPWYAEFRAILMTDKTLDGSWVKCITLAPHVTAFNPQESSFRLTLSGVTIYYDSSDRSGATLEQVNQNAEQLRDLGIKVDAIDTAVSNLDTKLTNQINTVKNDISSMKTDIKNQISDVKIDLENQMATQASQTQEKIDQAASQAHSDAEEAPNREYEYINGKDKELDKQVGDLNNSFDIADTNKGVVATLDNFWKMLSSDKSRMDIKFPAGNVNLTLNGEKKAFHLWDEISFSIEPYVKGDPDVQGSELVGKVLIVVKIVSLVFLISWAAHFGYDVVAWFLGDTNKSMSEIIFGFNPFT